MRPKTSDKDSFLKMAKFKSVMCMQNLTHSSLIKISNPVCFFKESKAEFVKKMSKTFGYGLPSNVQEKPDTLGNQISKIKSWA